MAHLFYALFCLYIMLPSKKAREHTYTAQGGQRQRRSGSHPKGHCLVQLCGFPPRSWDGLGSQASVGCTCLEQGTLFLPCPKVPAGRGAAPCPGSVAVLRRQARSPDCCSSSVIRTVHASIPTHLPLSSSLPALPTLPSKSSGLGEGKK